MGKSFQECHGADQACKGTFFSNSVMKRLVNRADEEQVTIDDYLAGEYSLRFS